MHGRVSASAQAARRIRVRGTVQGVGFRPHVFRAAAGFGITGWVFNDDEGVEIHAEGSEEDLSLFAAAVTKRAPAAAIVCAVDIVSSAVEGYRRFDILESPSKGHATTQISADLAICNACLGELFDPAAPRAFYPYINCTDCGPRFSLVTALPYDRPCTTMAAWPMCADCEREYADPGDRRFHAQPVACAKCGPHYYLWTAAGRGRSVDRLAVAEAAIRLSKGEIVAVKGIGGYHLACDAHDAGAVRRLRDRKYRKEKPFALMARDLDVARSLADVSPEAEAILTSRARPIVLVPKRIELEHVAPANCEYGVMLPYAPLHYLLYASGAPAALVFTSANRSSEPIAFSDEDALARLAGMADAWLIGERPIARRIDDSVVRAGSRGLGPIVLRRSRGYAPAAVARFPTRHPILATGGDLKNAVTLVVDGQAYVSQHIGDLDHHQAAEAFRETIADLTRMYAIAWDETLVAHDSHPQYASTSFAVSLPARQVAVQHHRAHVASVLAEREAWETRVVGVALDGTGFGDDGSIWGGEWFVGSLREGFERVGHLRPAVLPGGDAAARHPQQAAAGFLTQLTDLPDLCADPFCFDRRYAQSRQLVEKNVRVFPTTSTGRLFDTVAALAGFTREISFEGQAAIWLEHLAHGVAPALSFDMPIDLDRELDWRPALRAVIEARLRRVDSAMISAAFHGGLARAVVSLTCRFLDEHGLDTTVLSGGVFQNDRLWTDVTDLLEHRSVRVWWNQRVPPNDGGLSLGQAALAALANP
jgi:hydrogenase maturation protein HypF